MIGHVRFAFVASLPLSFWIACRIVSVAATVPAPVTYPVNTFPITAELVSVAALPTDVTSPVRFAFVVTVAAFPDILVWSPVFVPDDVPVTVPPPVAMLLSDRAVFS